ncbi:MAG TPA: ABC transporter ATP-binding protein [Candidatus Rubrimentiphilum sp.]|nr:ABC transporter ATP-binding protein [Candidatus Rubrimentiphilum sp.]
MNNDVTVAVRDLRMTYPGPKPVHALKGVSLEIKRGEMLLVMGPSGSGKSTLLSIIGGLLTPTSGSVVTSGTDLTHLGRKELARFRLRHFGYVFQGFNLFNSMTGSENVELAFHVRGVRGRDARKAARDLLSELGLHEQADRPARDLSGGEKQRVAIARALAGNPCAILADEPTSQLDAENGAIVTNILTELARSRGTTVVITSHDYRIRRAAERVVLLDDGKI